MSRRPVISRRHIDRDFNGGLPLEEAVATLACTPSEVAEFHCVLVRTQLFDEIGPLDEDLRSTSEHMDLCMLARGIGREDPARAGVGGRVRASDPASCTPTALSTCCAGRTSGTGRASPRFAGEARGLTEDDPSSEEMSSLGRRLPADRVDCALDPKRLDRAGNRVVPGFLSRVDRLAQRIIMERYERRRANGRGP